MTPVVRESKSSKILDVVSSMPHLAWMRPILEKKDVKTQRRIVRQWADLILWQTASEAERRDALKVREEFRRKAMMKHRRRHPVKFGK